MVSSNASLSPSDIMTAASPSQTLFFQLYKHKDDVIALSFVKELERDIKAPWVEEDTEEEGKRVDAEEALEDVNLAGTAGALVKNDDRDMTWEKVNSRPIWYQDSDICVRQFPGCVA
jgi:L-lactate dehydrogenase (cytochrome)